MNGQRLLLHPRIVARTTFDRLVTWSDHIIHPPNSNRDFSANFGEWIKANFQVSDSFLSNYRNELAEVDLLGRIERQLRLTLPSNFSSVHAPTGDWREILVGLYQLCRLSKPKRVVETGIGVVGGTSAFILEALRQNGDGHLWSVDPDRFYPVYGFHVGSGIPTNLSELHTIVRGEATRELPTVLNSLSGLDLFLHDGCHTYRNMAWEFDQVVCKLNPSAFLLSDDVKNAAIDDFSSRHRLKHSFINYGDSQFAIVRVGTLMAP